MPENRLYNNGLLIFRIAWILLVIIISVYLYTMYKPYISTPAVERHLDVALHEQFKPSGNISHGLGVIGTILMVLSFLLYFLRKRLESLEFLGPLSLWLEIHIFFGILGPILIFFHSTYALTGFIGIAFWLMVLVIVSGFFGRLLFGYCFWGISKIYEPMHLVDIYIEKDLKQDSAISPIVRRIMDLRPPGFPCTSGLIDTIKQWRFIKKETGQLLDLLNEKYDDIEYTEYSELHKRGDELIKRLREIRYISVLDLYLSVLNKWEFIHKACSYALFFMAFLHILVTVYWGYRWIF
ncbi:MAG: hypothetical protein ACMUIS_10420 [bacterium]